MQLLAGDIGGTHTRLQLGHWDGSDIHPGVRADYSSPSYAGVEDIVEDFLQNHAPARVDAACFAVAGPVNNDEAKVTNLPWHLRAQALHRSLGIQHIRLVNDFEAAAWGLDALDAADLLELQGGTPEVDKLVTRALIGAGTGFGQALILTQHQKTTVLATEGGHVDFAPRDEEELALWQYLRESFARISIETLLSGQGLVRLFSFYRQHLQREPSPELLQAMANDDPAKVVSEFALAAKDELAVRALRRFIAIYGAQAGNIALASKATGGVYIGGGIAPKIVPAFEHGEFLRAFLDKGPMDNLMHRIPVRLVLNPDLGLRGAMVLAAGRAA